MSSRYAITAAGPRSAKPWSDQDHTKVASRPLRPPFVGPAGNSSPCRGRCLLRALADMQTTRSLTEAIPQLGRYRIDPAGFSVAFRTRHLFGLAPVRGSFAVRGGTVDVSEPVTGSRVHVEIEAGSFRTGNPVRGRPGPVGPIPGRGRTPGTGVQLGRP